jgi:hypothetical protein
MATTHNNKVKQQDERVRQNSKVQQQSEGAKKNKAQQQSKVTR